MEPSEFPSLSQAKATPAKLAKTEARRTRRRWHKNVKQAAGGAGSITSDQGPETPRSGCTEGSVPGTPISLAGQPGEAIGSEEGPRSFNLVAYGSPARSGAGLEPSSSLFPTQAAPQIAFTFSDADTGHTAPAAKPSAEVEQTGQESSNEAVRVVTPARDFVDKLLAGDTVLGPAYTFSHTPVVPAITSNDSLVEQNGPEVLESPLPSVPAKPLNNAAPPKVEPVALAADSPADTTAQREEFLSAAMRIDHVPTSAFPKLLSHVLPADARQLSAAAIPTAKFEAARIPNSPSVMACAEHSDAYTLYSAVVAERGTEQAPADSTSGKAKHKVHVAENPHRKDREVAAVPKAAVAAANAGSSAPVNEVAAGVCTSIGQAASTVVTAAPMPVDVLPTLSSNDEQTASTSEQFCNIPPESATAATERVTADTTVPRRTAIPPPAVAAGATSNLQRSSGGVAHSRPSGFAPKQWEHQSADATSTQSISSDTNTWIYYTVGGIVALAAVGLTAAYVFRKK
jgi:hypothetical protein